MSERSRARFSCSCPRSETKEKGSHGGHGDTEGRASRSPFGVRRLPFVLPNSGSWLLAYRRVRRDALLTLKEVRRDALLTLEEVRRDALLTNGRGREALLTRLHCLQLQNQGAMVELLFSRLRQSNK